LVNAHTHLEFSDLSVPLGDSGMSLPEWIRLVIDHRHRRKRDPSFHATTMGLLESVGYGVTTIGEIAIPGTPDAPAWSPIIIQGVDVDVTVFLELIGLGQDKVRGALSLARDHLSRQGTNWRPALSPHAPYSTDIRLIAEAVALCARPGSPPLAIHLAESREELELLKTGAGELRRLLDDLGAWPEGGIAFGSRPLDYLQILAGADRAAVVHGNYLSDDEIDFLGRHRSRFAVVYCPRTHHFFRHDPYPLEKLLAVSVNVALGTDSRASNPDLDLLAELRFVADTFPRIAPETIIQFATQNGAFALGREANIGTLTPGKDANLTIISGENIRFDDPYRAILDTNAKVQETVIQGTTSFNRDP
jgi:cytosine/adenosine deaminase-related metal-dependent hydrolase